ncbi:ribbon-helix-helix protein, CopG family [Candidatus Viridilinea mediisalina]|uniref:Ribbon-helix-helix protein CopG domain-containing protein n=1 Tax=Candidatus Viridilinea mediisalina TaxID=2024553 RepID=A0A2A6RJK2_9CHLR|nr:hypothetical protein CJ255_10815 [Candidatus Viridilinea mediisalina]
MKTRGKSRKAVKRVDKESVRASISFPIEDYEKLEQAAVDKRVSLAWVVREAVREYLASTFSHSSKE